MDEVEMRKALIISKSSHAEKWSQTDNILNKKSSQHALNEYTSQHTLDSFTS